MQRVLKTCAALWKDDRGVVMSAEIIMIGSLLVVGAVAGLTAVRDNIVTGLSSFSQAIGSFNNSFCYGGVRGHCAWTSGSSFTDARFFNRGAVAVCGPTAVAANVFTGWGGGVGGYPVGSYGGGYVGGGAGYGGRPKPPAYVAEFPAPAVASAPCVTETPCVTPAPCATAVVQDCQTCPQVAAADTCCGPSIQVFVNGVPVVATGVTTPSYLPRTVVGQPNPGQLQFEQPRIPHHPHHPKSDDGKRKPDGKKREKQDE